MQVVNVDFETYSEGDIRKLGAWAYSKHPTTEVICMAYAFGGEAPILWLPGMELPEFARDPSKLMFHAWNSFFEYCIWHHVMNWPEVPIPRWSDTAALAATLALPRALGDCGAALGISQDKQKDKRGKYLIQRLCKPNRGKRIQDAELLQELYDYCVQDVVAEREISKRLRPLTTLERKVWELDQTVNIRGVFVDIAAVENALAIYEDVKEQQMFRLKELTGLDNPNSRDQFHQWLRGQGVDVPDVRKATLTTLLEEIK